MRTFIALFRGVNVGGKSKLAMQDLAPLMEGMGLERPASGVR